MMRIAGLSILLATLSMQSSTPPDERPGPGIPLSLAQERARRISNLSYDLAFSIPAERSSPVTGRATIRFDLSDVTRALALDFAAARGPQSAVVNGRTAVLQQTQDHLILSAADLRQGRNEITLEFVAGEPPLNRNSEFLYTLFVPARAHSTFPCFDQPDLKARWQLTLTIPADWEAVANGAVSSQSRDGKQSTISFAETAPLPTYLFAFGAGRFSVETAERDGRTFRMLHRETDAAKVARNRDAIFDLHASALRWLEDYTGIRYPWGKFDFLLVPSFQFGGMEHAGAVFYNASALLLDPSATQNQKLGRASLIAHETAHMWFGDLVTMKWFNDVWMKEVFANFMAANIVNPSFPEINHPLRFLLAHYPAAYDVDRTPGTNAIRQRLENLNEAGSLYGAIIYQKAPIVMRQLEGIVGEAELREGLREYLRAYNFGNATWADLIAILDARTPEDLAAWSQAWVEEAGRPVITTDLHVVDGRITRLAFRQRDPVQARGLSWIQQLRVAIGQPDGQRLLGVRISGPVTEVPDAIGLAAPRYVLPTGEGVGYGGFELDRHTIDYLREHVASLPDPLTRGAAWVTLWEQMLDRRLPASSVIALALRALPRETDEQNVQRILNYTQQAFWKFLPAGERAGVASELEHVLRAGLAAAPSSSLKAAWFSALRDTARSRETIAWLERVWRTTESVPGLTLAEPDYITLALHLALLEVQGWQEILDEQVGRTENPDRRERLVFVRPSVSADQGVRDSFFERLRHAESRQREPWVLEGLSYLHHPIRAAASETYIEPSLSMLTEIQRTGDIFFPKRWMDATLSGHSSTTAAHTVRRFLRELPPNYPDRLRRVILSASDDLFRASGVER